MFDIFVDLPKLVISVLRLFGSLSSHQWCYLLPVSHLTYCCRCVCIYVYLCECIWLNCNLFL